MLSLEVPEYEKFKENFAKSYAKFEKIKNREYRVDVGPDVRDWSYSEIRLLEKIIDELHEKYEKMESRIKLLKRRKFQFSKMKEEKVNRHK